MDLARRLHVAKPIGRGAGAEGRVVVSRRGRASQHEVDHRGLVAGLLEGRLDEQVNIVNAEMLAHEPRHRGG